MQIRILRASENPLGDGFDDLLVDFVDGEVAFDQDDALGLAGGDLAVFLPDAAIESVLLGLEAVFVAAGFGFDAVVAAARAGQRDSKPGSSRSVRSGCSPPQISRCRLSTSRSPARGRRPGRLRWSR